MAYNIYVYFLLGYFPYKRNIYFWSIVNIDGIIWIYY